jgi:type II secretory pathway component HofQ
MHRLLPILALAAAPLFAVEAVKITEKEMAAPDASGNVNLATTDRRLEALLQYLGRAGNVKFALADDAIKEIFVTEAELKDVKNVTWRGALELICRRKKLRIDERRLEKERVLTLSKPELITMKFKGADVREVIFAIAQAGKLNVVIDPDVKGEITLNFTDVPCDEAITTIAKALGYEIVIEKNSYRVK